MPDPLRYILIGTGGAGATWCRSALPRLMAMQKAVPVAAADPSEDRLGFAREYFQLTPQQCFTDPMEVLENRRADFAIITTPLPQHEKLIEAAITHDMHILCEAPLADSIQATLRIYRRSKKGTKKQAGGGRNMAGQKKDEAGHSLCGAHVGEDE